MNITKVIKSCVDDSGLKRSYIAGKIGLSETLLNRTLAGKRKLKADEFILLCKVLQIDLTYFEKPQQTA